MRNRSLGAAVAAAGLLTALFAAGPAAATPDPGELSPGISRPEGGPAAGGRVLAPGEIPGQDEIVHSANVRHLTNVPSTYPGVINTDLAFQGKYAYAGNYNGFT
ncbi:hypothetical protein GTW69_41695, partial [Streptomyces sp. SID7760]|nr:hypothetical protein [Streptomyces sp. SID7760]